MRESVKETFYLFFTIETAYKTYHRKLLKRKTNVFLLTEIYFS